MRNLTPAVNMLEATNADEIRQAANDSTWYCLGMTARNIRSDLALVVIALAASFLIASCTKTPAEAGNSLGRVTVSADSLQLTPSGSFQLSTETSSPVVDLGLVVIRTFANQPDLRLDFKETTTFINSPNADALVDIYQDDWGTSYYVDPNLNIIVQFNVGNLFVPVGELLKEDELKARAENLFDRELSPIPGGTDNLSFELGIKQGSTGPASYFFRWQSTSGGWLYNPPIFQVGLRADGTLLTYVNTLGYR